MRYHHSDEALCRVPSVHQRYRAHHVRSEVGDPPARSRVQKTSRREPAQARAETKGQAFRFPRPCRLVATRRTIKGADQFGIGQVLAGDLRHRKAKPLGIVHVFPVVEPERLFVNVTEQVIGFHAHVGAVDPTLQKRPKILASVSVNLPVHVSNRMIDHLMFVLFAQSVA